jgi:hypothetical protein
MATMRAASRCHRPYPKAPPQEVAAYSQRANHGRFNSIWDTGDAGPLTSWMLDRGSLLSADQQEDLAKALVGAFLARSLEGRIEYDAFLE